MASEDGSAASSTPSMGSDVAFRRAASIDAAAARYPGFEPGTSVIPSGTSVEEGALPLPCEMVCERDVPVSLRDGTVIYTDVYRPAGGTRLPTLVAWSPYGKRAGVRVLDDFPGRGGVPRSAVSGLQKWEGPDPAYWCSHGYAVVNPDARGAFGSEGDIWFFGRDEGDDAFDVVEWAAAQAWSNGRVGLAGNSWLAVAQWFVAAARPPHLAAIAPWEGFTDMYRHALAPGGLVDTSFVDMLTAKLVGRGRVEDTVAMVERQPLWCDYWERKRARCENIEVPAYVVASWTNPLHTVGTLEGFLRLGSQEKWLRIHNTHEWPDLYEYTDDLRRFFDRYLALSDNGWEQTPPVRLSILDPGGTDTVDRPEETFPPGRAQHRPLYLDASTCTLRGDPPDGPSSCRYAADDGESHAAFVFRFEESTELVGYPKLRLWVEAVGSDDMDLFVLVQKLDSCGRLLRHEPHSGLGGAPLPIAYFTGPRGRLRVSRRELDPVRSTPSRPFLALRSEMRLQPGEVVPVEIAISPVGLRWRAGEHLRVVVAGHDLSGPALPGLEPPPLRNRGYHVIHAGPGRDSHLLVPWSRATP